MQKIRVAVLRGGTSDEYDISLKTGASVLKNLNSDLFEAIDVIITKQGEWLVNGCARYPEKILSCVDAVFIALHGAYGEDGTVQRLLDRFGVPYTGSKAFPSNIAMHKDLTKKALKETGIKMAPHIVVTRDSLPHLAAVSEKIADTFGPQYFIKPVASGSSAGTMMVKNPALLPNALSDALSLYPEVMVEARIMGTEATCGVIERFRGSDLYSLPPIEIIPPSTAEFFDSTNKYDNSTTEICPGRFNRHTTEEIESLSKQVHETLGLSQYSRSDFIVSEDGIYFLEVNTLPGLTESSLLPKAIEAVGSSYAEFITHLLHDAMKKWD